jgi:hypothetical protein
LDVWDYFYCSHYPCKGDEKPWATIERATHRIRASEMYLDPPRAPDLRLQHARRVRNAARVALRNIALLSIGPEPWVIDRLVDFEAFGHKLVRELSALARDFITD